MEQEDYAPPKMQRVQISYAGATKKKELLKSMKILERRALKYIKSLISF